MSNRIKTDIGDLPAAPRNEGNPPSPNPKFVTQLAEAWYADLVSNNGHGHDLDLTRAIPEAGPYRGSYASKRCDRDLYYALSGVEQSDPPGVADQWRFAIGHMVHDGIQKVMNRVHDGKVLVENDVDLNPAGIPGSAHADLIVLDDDGAEVCVVEYKTINGFGFKMAATTFKGPPEGPRSGHALQAAMVAVARGVPYFAVGYFSLENLSPSMAADFANGEIGRFTAEWRYKTDDWVGEVNREAQRVARILDDIDQGRMSPRRLDDPEYPENAIVEEPDRKGRWTATTDDGIVVGTGTAWMCDYCSFRTRCIEDGPS